MTNTTAPENAYFCGFLIAAPHSGSGKTTVTLGLLRALRNRAVAVGPAKAGPDFIDPVFHSIASGVECVNLDAYAMRPSLVGHLASQQAANGGLVVEAMMGLFDGAADGTGSAADLAIQLGLPVVLVVDASKQSHSIAALVAGFRDFSAGLVMAGVILNKVGSPRHETMLRSALDKIGVKVLGVVSKDTELVLPSRHLGLVQAREHAEIDAFMDHAALVMEQAIDIEALLGFKLDNLKTHAPWPVAIAPLGQRIAIARDEAFAFCYPHIVAGWREQGAAVSTFSPLANEAPDVDADAVYLPGGYPELHGGQLAGSHTFLNGLKDAAQRGASIYGECGGYMVLGEGLRDKNGERHRMANLLPLETSFEHRKLQLGYRVATLLSDNSLGQKGSKIKGHEFHYSTVVKEGRADRLFSARDALGQELGEVGLRIGNVMGSYFHMIDQEART